MMAIMKTKVIMNKNVISPIGAQLLIIIIHKHNIPESSFNLGPTESSKSY